MSIPLSTLPTGKNLTANRSATIPSCRGRPLHDICHSESRTSILSVQNEMINMKGFFILFCCMIFALHARVVMGYLLQVLKAGVSAEPELIINLYKTFLSVMSSRSSLQGVAEAVLVSTGGAVALFIIQKFSAREGRARDAEDTGSLQSSPKTDTKAHDTFLGHYVSWTDALDTVLYGGTQDEHLESEYEVSIAACINVDLGVPPDVTEKIEKKTRPIMAPSARIKDTLHQLHLLWPTIISIIIVIVIFVNIHYILMRPHVEWRERSVICILLFSVSMKCLSFTHVCHDTRRAFCEQTDLMYISGTEEELALLQRSGSLRGCLRLNHYLRYLLLPTLSFQFIYPTTTKIDWHIVVRHLVLFICWGLAIRIVITRYLMPPLFEFFRDDLWRYTPSLSTLVVLSVNYVLTIAFPLVFSWITMFFMCFHDGLTFIAELLQFGDRCFYLDWWNASNLAEYWRKWNLPVHNFATRHVYKPLLANGWNRWFASLVIFLVSAACHEYMAAMIVRQNCKGFVLIAFVAQLPLMSITNSKWFRTHKNFGNVFFWITFCLTGQPTVVLYIYYQVALKNNLLQPREMSWQDTLEGETTQRYINTIVTHALDTINSLKDDIEGLSQIGLLDLQRLLGTNA